MSQEQEVFIAAEQALLKVVQQIPADAWDKKITEPLAAGKDINLRTLINYHAYDDIWVPETLAGKTIAEVGDKYQGDLLGTDPAAMFAGIEEKAIAAVEGLLPEDLDKQVHLTYGDFAVRDYLKHITTFRGFRAYTIANYLGLNTALPAELVDGLWDEVVPEVDGWRAMGVFGPAIDPPEGADKQTKLLCLVGMY